MISERYESFWNEQRGAAALGLAEGKSQLEVAQLVGVTDRTIRNWLDDDRFIAEIDRLSLMVGVASRAERLRLVNRLVKQKVRQEDGFIFTEKDLLDWLKFAQSETDGAKIDLSKLAELLAGESAAEHGPPQQLGAAIETTAIESRTSEELSDGVVTGDDDGEVLNPS
jgi:transcriptional regulator with XRE-family HTH domain